MEERILNLDDEALEAEIKAFKERVNSENKETKTNSDNVKKRYEKKAKTANKLEAARMKKARLASGEV